MPYYAIGCVRETSGKTAIRLINTDNLIVNDIKLNEIPLYSKLNGGIHNIEVSKRGEIKWKQGAVKRYPIIDKMNNTIRNGETVVVLGVTSIDDIKYYKVSNLYGNTTTVKDSELIAYGEKYGIANCKVVTRYKKKYIASIDKSIPELESKPKWRFNYELKTLEVEIPILLSDELVIPESTPNGKLIMDITSIIIKPVSSGLLIKKLVISKHIKDINYGLFYSMPNLEEIDIRAKDATLYGSAFIRLKKLRKLHLNGVEAMGNSICEGLKNLEEVSSDSPIKYIANSAFSGCKKLDITYLFKEGLEQIDSKAFKTTPVTSLIFPSTLRTIAYSSFDECKDLKHINCLSEILYLKASSNKQRAEGCFARLNNIKMEVKVNTTISGKLAGNVQLVYKEKTKEDEALLKKIRKSNFLGININPDQLLINCTDIANAVIASPQEDITRAVTDLVTSSIGDRVRAVEYKDYVIGCFKVRLKYTSSGDKKIKKVKNIGKYIVLMGKYLTFVPVDKMLLYNYFLNIPNIAPTNQAVIQPQVAESKYIKSVDILDNGTIRLIYQDTKGNIQLGMLDFYAIHKDN